jgi:hypothetical protein
MMARIFLFQVFLLILGPFTFWVFLLTFALLYSWIFLKILEFVLYALYDFLVSLGLESITYKEACINLIY